MDLVIENVGRRSEQWGGEGDPTDLGDASLNGRERNALYWNRGADGFEEVGFYTNANRSEDGRSVAVADFDRDGRLDLAVQNLDRPVVLLMGRGEVGNWLQVSLETADGRDPLGARLVAQVGAKRHLRQVVAGSGFLSSSSRVQHFGLGDAEQVDSLEIHWPSGARDRLTGIAANQRIVVREGERQASTGFEPASSGTDRAR